MNAPPASTTRTYWWHEPFEMFQTNLREIDATLDVESVLDAIQEHGANTWLLNAGGILSNYPTDLSFQTRNPWLTDRSGGDLLRDATQAAHERGMRLLARMDFSKIAPEIAERHPEWCFRSRTGELQRYEGLVSVCPSGAYYQERTFDVLDEILGRYPVDGFFFNWFGFNEVDYSRVVHGVCHCASCVEAFARETGLPSPPASATDPSYGRWRRFTAATIDRLTARIRDHIQARHPDVALVLGRHADIRFHEANNAVGRSLWAWATADAVSASTTVAPDTPVLVNAVAFVDMPYRRGAEDPRHYEQYFVQALARGANPSTYIMGTPGDITYDCLPAAAVVTRFRAAHHDIYRDLRPDAHIALVQPDSLLARDATADSAAEEFRGLHEALRRLHRTFDVLAAGRLVEAHERGELDRFRLLVLPDLAHLPTAALAAVDAFVRAGGAVLATGRSGAGPDGVVGSEVLPVRRLGAAHHGLKANRSSYVRTAAGDAPVYDTRWDVEWHEAAQPRAAFLAQAPFGPPEKAYGHTESGEPGWAVRRAGQGVAAQVPWSIGRALRTLGNTSLRRLLTDVLDEIVGTDPIADSSLHEQVEVVIGRSGAARVVHLLNQSGFRDGGFVEPVPILSASLRVAADTPVTARSLVHDTACRAVLEQDGTALIHLPPLGLFDVITIEESNPKEGPR